MSDSDSIRKRMAGHPSRTRLHGELADGREALAERIERFEDPEEQPAPADQDHMDQGHGGHFLRDARRVGVTVLASAVALVGLYELGNAVLGRGDGHGDHLTPIERKAEDTIQKNEQSHHLPR